MKWMLGVICLLALPACQKDRSIGRTDSASHWMRGCAVDSECGPLACLCGVCTLPCADAECAQLGGECAVEEATCQAAPAPLCVTRCGDGRQWNSGACEPIESDARLPDAGRMDMSVSPMDMTVDQAFYMSLDQAVDMPLPDQAVDMAIDMMPDAAPSGECSNPDRMCEFDAECGGRPCSALFPTGPCQCTMPDPPRFVPCAGGCCGPGECGDDAVCQGIGLDHQNTLCNAMPEPADNQCVAQACTHDVECGAGRTCIRPGEWGHVRSQCVPARCQQDSDCDREPGGQCRGFFTPCYNRGFACAYPSDPCRADADCDQRGGPRGCLPVEGGGTECVPIP